MPACPSGIYQILCLQTGKRYVGSAKNLDRRKKEHFGNLELNRHQNKHFQNAFNKYGSHMFEFVVLEAVPDLSKLVEREQVYIDKHDSANLFNICIKAANTMLGLRWKVKTKKTQEERDRTAKALTGRRTDPEICSRISKSLMESSAVVRLRSEELRKYHRDYAAARYKVKRESILSTAKANAIKRTLPDYVKPIRLSAEVKLSRKKARVHLANQDWYARNKESYNQRRRAASAIRRSQLTGEQLNG